MTHREHPSREAAVREAVAHGFWPAHSSDGRLVLSDGKKQLGVLRESRPRSVVYHLAEIPA